MQKKVAEGITFMRVLALESYYGGSHRAFVDGWIERSSHDWTLLTLPARKWKWRMRHAAVSFASDLSKLVKEGKMWDGVFCSDMFNLAELRALAPVSVARLPMVFYFHENQLTYPVGEESERDYHFVLSNMVSALAADRVWFNSSFHRESFLDALSVFLRRMPDYRPLGEVDAIRKKSEVHWPCIDPLERREVRQPGPLRILWVARWEADKAPHRFFGALQRLQSMGVDFRIHVVGGGEGRTADPSFAEARERFEHRILRWGYQGSREEYEKVLLDSDVVVSTADHEFFGIGVLEAVAAGAFPLVPRRLAYPEVFEGSDVDGVASFFYEGGEEDLALRLADLAEYCSRGDVWQGRRERGVRVAHRYAWEQHIHELDRELELLVGANSVGC